MKNQKKPIGLKPIKALVLLSGGLDSLLTAKLLQQQKIAITGLTFKSPFFKSTMAEKSTKQLKIPLKIIDISQEHLKIVKNPAYGYGKAANPCLDCHLLMLKKAKAILKKNNFHFIATGEVLGERPFSQTKKALTLIEKKSGLSSQILRPLSAKLLKPTLAEKKGWVNRAKLLNISGRSRKTQLKLAKKFNLKFPSPSGGCPLCEKEFAKKFFDLLEKWPNFTSNDCLLLFLGRHFWDQKTKIILGKNKKENKKLAQLKQNKDKLVIPKNFPGPTGLIRGEKISTKTITKTKKLIIKYTGPKKTPLKPSFSLA
jgi:hypothetical protein